MSINAPAPIPTPLSALGDYEKVNLNTDSEGMELRIGSKFDDRVQKLAKDLQDEIQAASNELDNPVVLAKISGLNGHYNSARQLQSSIMKSIKDTAQSIIRNI